MAKWFIYALGGGWGHLNRAIALGRQAADQHHVQILTNSPYAPWVQSQIHAGVLSLTSPQNLTLQIIPTAAFAETRQLVQRMVQTQDYDCLIVDTFPRGLGGELMDCFSYLTAVPKVLIHRDLTPAYVEAKQLIPFVKQHYDGILIPGEGVTVPFADLPQVRHTPPWVMFNANELPPVVPQSRPLVVVVAAGNPNEMAFWGQLIIRLQVAFPAV